VDGCLRLAVAANRGPRGRKGPAPAKLSAEIAGAEFYGAVFDEITVLQAHEFEGEAIFDVAHNAPDLFSTTNDANIFVDDGDGKFVHVFAARLALEIFEAFAFDLTRKQRADTGAGKADPDLVNEVSRQDESLGEDMANIRRVDIGARGGRPPAAFARPIVEQCLRRVLLHYSPKPVRHVLAMLHLSPDGTDAQPPLS